MVDLHAISKTNQSLAEVSGVILVDLCCMCRFSGDCGFLFSVGLCIRPWSGFLGGETLLEICNLFPSCLMWTIWREA